MVLSYPATLAQLDDRVKRRLFTADSSQDPTDTTPDHWKANRRQDAINQAQQTVYLLLCQKYEDEYFVERKDDVVPTNNIIQLPENCRRVLSFDKNVNGQWMPIRLVSASRYREYALPFVDTRTIYAITVNEVWTQTGRELNLEGVGTATGPYRLRWQKRLLDLQGRDDVCEIPPEYQDAVVFYAAGLLATDAQEETRAASLFALYGKEEEKIIKTAVLMNLAKQQRVKDTRSLTRWR